MLWMVCEYSRYFQFIIEQALNLLYKFYHETCCCGDMTQMETRINCKLQLNYNSVTDTVNVGFMRAIKFVLLYLWNCNGVRKIIYSFFSRNYITIRKSIHRLSDCYRLYNVVTRLYNINWTTYLVLLDIILPLRSKLILLVFLLRFPVTLFIKFHRVLIL